MSRASEREHAKHLTAITSPVWVHIAHDAGRNAATTNPDHGPEINREVRANAGLVNVQAVADERLTLALSELSHLAAVCNLAGDLAGHDAVMLGHKAIVDLFGRGRGA